LKEKDWAKSTKKALTGVVSLLPCLLEIPLFDLQGFLEVANLQLSVFA
jgi:hypothetical protein